MTAKTCLFKLAAVAGIVSLSVATSQADITTGLVGYWSLSSGPGSSTVSDLSGNGNTGTLTNFSDGTYNNMWTPNTDPHNGWPYALEVNQSGEGANDYVNIPNSTSLNTPTANKSWTLSAWVYPTTTSQNANAGIVCKGTGTFSGGTYAYSLGVYSGKFAGGLRNSAGTAGFIASNSVAFTANTWYHVVLTVQEPKGSQNSEMSLYVNGSLVAGTNSNTYTTVYSSTQPVTIGCFGPGAQPFAGIIDEVRIYNRQLSQSDVTQLYNNSAFGPLNSGVGSWIGATGSGGNAILDGTSANFSTNIYSAPLSTLTSLPNLLSYESAISSPLDAIFADAYFSNKVSIGVTSTNLTIAAGGVAFGSSAGPGSLIFDNNAVTYVVASSDATGITDGANPTAVVQDGTGTAILTGTNTYSGGTTINYGTIQVGNGGPTGSPLGSGPVADNASLIFDGSDNPSFTAAITGVGSLTQTGTGTLTLGVSNTYSAGTTINSGGTISVSSMADGTSSIGTGPVSFGSTGGNIVYTGTGDTTTRQFNGATGSVNSIDVPNGVSLTLSGRVTGSAAWTMNKLDSGTLVLGGSGDNSFLGMTVEGGTVILNKAGASGHAIGNPLIVANGGVVQMGTAGYNGQIYSNNTAPVTIQSGGTLDLNGQTQGFFSLSLAGNGGGSGALINSASGQYAALSVLSLTLPSAATIGGSGEIDLPSTVIISGPGSLTYSGSSTLELDGQNTYTGGTIVNSGTLDAHAAFSIPGNVTVNSGGVLELDDAAAMSFNSTLSLPANPPAGTVNLAFGGGNANIAALYIGGVAQPPGTYGASGATYSSSTFTGGGILNVGGNYWDGNGQDAVTGTNTSGGGSGSWDSSSSDWWLAGNSDAPWSSGEMAYFGGTPGIVTLNSSVQAEGLVFTTGGYLINNTDGVSSLSLSGSVPTISVASGTTTIGCTVYANGNEIGFAASGPGTLALTGNNASASTLIENGATLSANTIADSGTSAIGTGSLTMNNGTLAYTGSSATTSRNITLEGTVTSGINVSGGNSLEIDGQIHEVSDSAAQGLAFNGGGTLILGGSVDNSSLAMAINQGEVIISKTTTNTVHGLGGGTSIIGSGAELQLAGSGGFDLYSGCVLTVNSGGLLDVNGQNDSFSTLTLSGNGFGSGALINNSGTPSLLTNAGSGVVLSGSATVGGSGAITLASAVSGTGSLIYAGTGTLTLGAAGTYSGGTTVNSGTLQLNNASAAGTGTIADNATLAVNIAAGTLTNTITGGSNSVINIIETSGDNLSLNGNMSSFTGTINCPTSPGSTAKAQIEANCNLPTTAIINVAAGGTLFLPEDTCAAQIVLNGVGNSEVYGALRLDGATETGPILLNGNTTIGNGNSALSTYGGVISDGGHGYGITKTATANPVQLTGVNTYTGPTTNSQGILGIAGSGCLGATALATNYATNLVNNGTFVYASSAAQTLSGVVSGTGEVVVSGAGSLTLTDTNTFTGAISNSGNLIIGGSGCLGASATATNYAGLITNNGTFKYNSSAAQLLSGVISGTGNLVDNGSGKLTLSNIDTYSGGTIIGSGATLALASATESINGTSFLNIGAGGTFDVSTYTLAYVLGTGSTTLSGAGTGTTPGSTAATVKASANGTTVTVSALSLNYTPQTFNGDATHPALSINPGSLDINGTSIYVTNAAATPLGAGTYSLVQATGSITCATTTAMVVGTGLAANTAASLAVSGGSLNLVVSNTAVSVPVINNVTLTGGNLVFSGTNGPDGGTFYVLTSTNIALPVSQWTPIATNSFSGSGSFSVTNSVSKSPSFFIIEVH